MQSSPAPRAAVQPQKSGAKDRLKDDSDFLVVLDPSQATEIERLLSMHIGYDGIDADSSSSKASKKKSRSFCVTIAVVGLLDNQSVLPGLTYLGPMTAPCSSLLRASDPRGVQPRNNGLRSAYTSELLQFEHDEGLGVAPDQFVGVRIQVAEFARTTEQLVRAEAVVYSKRVKAALRGALNEAGDDKELWLARSKDAVSLLTMSVNSEDLVSELRVSSDWQFSANSGTSTSPLQQQTLLHRLRGSDSLEVFRRKSNEAHFNRVSRIPLLSEGASVSGNVVMLDDPEVPVEDLVTLIRGSIEIVLRRDDLKSMVLAVPKKYKHIRLSLYHVTHGTGKPQTVRSLDHCLPNSTVQRSYLVANTGNGELVFTGLCVIAKHHGNAPSSNLASACPGSIFLSTECAPSIVAQSCANVTRRPNDPVMEFGLNVSNPVPYFSHVYKVSYIHDAYKCCRAPKLRMSVDAETGALRTVSHAPGVSQVCSFFSSLVDEASDAQAIQRTTTLLQTNASHISKMTFTSSALSMVVLSDSDSEGA